MRKRNHRHKHRAGLLDEARHMAHNPVTLALIRGQIIADIERLRTASGLHAFMGGDGQEAVYHIGRITYMVCHAAGVHGLGNSPEARILAGTANALADLAEKPDTLDQQRNTLIAGLAAIDRLMPHLSQSALAAGAIRLQEMINRTEGMGTADIRRALGI